MAEQQPRAFANRSDRSQNWSVNRNYFGAIAEVRSSRASVSGLDQTFWGGLSVTQDDLILLSRDLNGYPPWLQGEVSKRHVFQAAFKLKQPIEAVLTRLRQFQPLGLILPQGDPKTWQD